MPPEAFFSGPGLDRADQLRGQPEAIADLARRPNARALLWDNGAPVVAPDGKLAWQPIAGETPLFLGFEGEAPRFSALPDGGVPVNARAHWGLLAQLDEAEAPLFAAALSLANWHRRHGHCSVCGTRTDPNRGGWSRACPTCQAEHYPRSDPVVIMLAEDGDRLLLGRQPTYPPGRYSALAGFVEPGETIEAAVTREIGEEAGIRVADVRYVASQPWPFPSSLMIGCTSTALDTEIRIDTTELDDARWFTRDEVRAAMEGRPGAPFEAPPRFAIAFTLLNHWLDA
ncbi:NAD(+) diphosphatase [Sphingomonas ginkgonis]|uniref:NAD(+) diphosphatase n=1 Tax=Sphingomonas ginkgonis TaxID=2315330 RepID=A0A429V7Q2_9SPHN|nr:NAD(+) diphosphatase [Sphingomonas ginkgonis]RST29949.1 NAD(+) diphosphatase [Sphingomonas ginkgonis]